MMEFIDSMPLWGVALSIFLLRIVDVSLGTIRTVFVVQGRVVISVLIGFVEVLVWVTAVSQVITRIHESPLLVVAFAAGFAAGNACGIKLERQLALGSCVVRMITKNGGGEIARALREAGHTVTTFEGQGADGHYTLVYTACPRRKLPAAVRAAKDLDPDLFFAVDRFSESWSTTPLPHPTGWRSVFKKK
ncbi:MAG: DUF5698 domain-containing protein [Gemmatimonadales bacterium]|jgi:uncharacterized protein YebE (UPF0316 family)